MVALVTDESDESTYKNVTSPTHKVAIEALKKIEKLEQRSENLSPKVENNIFLIKKHHTYNLV